MEKTIDLIEVFKREIEQNPDDSKLHYFLRASAKAKICDYLGAIEDYTNSIERTPNDLFVYSQLGALKIETDDFTGAIKDLTCAINIDPEHSLSYLNRGIAKMGVIDYLGAHIDICKAIEIEPEFAEAYYARGRLRIELGHYNEGKFRFKQSL